MPSRHAKFAARLRQSSRQPLGHEARLLATARSAAHPSAPDADAGIASPNAVAHRVCRGQQPSNVWVRGRKAPPLPAVAWSRDVARAHRSGYR